MRFSMDEKEIKELDEVNEEALEELSDNGGD